MISLNNIELVEISGGHGLSTGQKLYYYVSLAWGYVCGYSSEFAKSIYYNVDSVPIENKV
jgi:hypothetical protein